jgi:hypothetical protein
MDHILQQFIFDRIGRDGRKKKMLFAKYSVESTQTGSNHKATEILSHA